MSRRIAIDARKIRDFGIGTYIRGLMQGLDAISGDETFIALAPPDARELLPPSFEFVPVEAPHYSFRELFIVGRAAERAGADLVHAPHYVTPVTSLPIVVTIHDLIHLHQPQRNPLARLYAQTMLRRAVRKSARVLTVSDAVAREIANELACPAEKLVVTPNGIDARFHPPADLAGASDYFLFVGNDKPHKNLATLVDAFALVREARPALRLRLVGGSFARYAGTTGIDVAGFVADEELPRLYAGAIALVMPSREEGFGLPAAEAMACGTPVVTSDAGALVELTGDAALHVDATNPRAIAEAMFRIVREPELRALLSRRGITRASAFTWTRCATTTIASYRAALAR